MYSFDLCREDRCKPEQKKTIAFMDKNQRTKDLL